jgi:hypothetical protein
MITFPSSAKKNDNIVITITGTSSVLLFVTTTAGANSPFTSVDSKERVAGEGNTFN